MIKFLWWSLYSRFKLSIFALISASIIVIVVVNNAKKVSEIPRKPQIITVMKLTKHVKHSFLFIVTHSKWWYLGITVLESILVDLFVRTGFITITIKATFSIFQSNPCIIIIGLNPTGVNLVVLGLVF